MRRAIGQEIETLEGTAESIPLPDNSADAVTVGQAFHWFDGELALAEAHRVLRPGGALALLWNTRRMDDAIHVSIERLIRPHCEQVPRHGTRAWREPFTRTPLFEPLEEVEFEHEQRLEAHELEARVASTSAIAALSAEVRVSVLCEGRSHAASGPVTLRYRCEVHLTGRT